MNLAGILASNQPGLTVPGAWSNTTPAPPGDPSSGLWRGHPLGLPGATAPTRYVGATASTSPSTGTFLVGDFVITNTGGLWVCTAAGSPGTWTLAGGGGGAVSSVFTRTGAVTATSGDYTAAQVTNAADKASGSAQTFTSPVIAPFLAAAGLTGATSGSRYAGATLSGAPVAGSFLTGDFVIDHTGMMWVCTASGIPGTWSSGASPSGPNVVFDTPEAHGALGDRVLLTGVTVTNSSHVLTCASAAFGAGDVGKHVLACNPADGTTLSTTITSVTDTHHVVLAATTADFAATFAIYGTDDTAAIRAAISNIVSIARTSGSNTGELWLSNDYIVSGACVTGATKGNAQIPLPLCAGTAEKFDLKLRGSGDASALSHWYQTGPHMPASSIISTLQGQAYDGTNGAPSVIGGPTPEQGYSGLTSNNMLLRVDGVSIIVPADPTISGLDLRGTAEMAYGTYGYFAFGNPTTWPLPTSGSGNGNPYAFACGLRVPGFGNNAYSVGDSYGCEGAYSALDPNEHMNLNSVKIDNCRVALGPSTTYQFPARITHLQTGEVRSHLYSAATRSGSQALFLDVDTWEVEDGPTPWTSIYHIYDPTNDWRGTINFSLNGGLAGTTLLVDAATSAANLRLRDIGRPAGHVTAPAVPATTVALQNPYWRDAAVNIVGGTVTVIAVDGTATGLTSGTVIVPAGKTVTLTYSAAPTWVWTLL
jgi:hypothetical protein